MNKTNLKRVIKVICLPILVIGLYYVPDGLLSAQVFTNLYSFAALGLYNTNSTGAYPHSSLVLSGSTLYGTTYAGGNSGGGTVFKINTDGSGLTNVYSFSAMYCY